MVGPTHLHLLAYESACELPLMHRCRWFLHLSVCKVLLGFFFFSFSVKLFEGIGLTVLGRTEFNLFLSNQIMGKMPGKWLPNSWHCSEITELGEFVR